MRQKGVYFFISIELYYSYILLEVLLLLRHNLEYKRILEQIKNKDKDTAARSLIF